MPAIVPSISTSALNSIQDPHTRDVLRQVVSGWQTRNGQSGSGENAFLTEADLKGLLKTQNFSKLVADSVVDNLKALMPGAAYEPVKPIINELQAQILADPFFAYLGERIKLIDTPKTGLIDKMIGAQNGIYKLDQTLNDPANGLYSELRGVGLRVGGATTGYASLTQLKADATSASYEYTNQVKASLNNAIEAGDVAERNYRVNSDNALAESVNTIWAVVGDGTALVQSGSSAIANRTGAIAQAWQQVQATLKDPTTGKILTSVVGRTEFAVANSKITGLAAKYTVKIDSGGYVVGYGLASDTDPNGKTNSRFYVRADKFAIGSANNTVDPIDGDSPGAKIPFIVTTIDQIINGQRAPAGVYMDNAFIANGSIDSLKVGVASIDTAHIKDLSVNTLKIGNNSVTVPAYMNGGGGSVFGAGTLSLVGAIYVTYPALVNIVALVSWSSFGGGENTNTRVEVRVAGGGLIFGQSDSVIANFTSSHAGSGKGYMGPGSYQIEIWFGNDWSGGAYTLGQWSCTLLGVMK